MKHPNLGKSAYIVHKEIPEDPAPQSAIPTDFLKAVEHPNSEEAKNLNDKLEKLNQVNQIGSGSDSQVEAALKKPVKVGAIHFPIILLKFILSSLNRSQNSNSQSFWTDQNNGNWQKKNGNALGASCNHLTRKKTSRLHQKKIRKVAKEANLMRLRSLILLANLVTSAWFDKMNVQETGTYQAQSRAEQFFRKLPLDNRYISVVEQQFEPKSGLQVNA